MVAVFFGVELGIGLWSGSLTLQGDAGHMAVDLIGLGIALFATSLATRPDSTGRMTYGRYRAEIFSAGFSAALMFAVSIYIVIEAIHRWSNPHQLAPLPILVVGALGLGINIASLVLLQGGSKESLNIKGAYLEVMADALGSIGIIVAAALTMLTGTPIWDSLIAAAIAVFIFVRAFGLGREVLAILGQQAPKGISPKDAHDALAAVPGVDEVHDLHLWALTSGMNVATAHLVSETESEHCRILADAAEVMRAQFGIDHATLQVETSAVCHRTDW